MLELTQTAQRSQADHLLLADARQALQEIQELDPRRRAQLGRLLKLLKTEDKEEREDMSDDVPLAAAQQTRSCESLRGTEAHMTAQELTPAQAGRGRERHPAGSAENHRTSGPVVHELSPCSAASKLVGETEGGRRVRSPSPSGRRKPFGVEHGNQEGL